MCEKNKKIEIIFSKQATPKSIKVNSSKLNKMNTFIDLSGYEITQDVFNNLPSKRKNAVSTIYGYIYTDNINDLYNLPVIENKKQWIFNYDNIIFILDLVEMDMGNNIIRLTCSNNNCSKIAKFIKIKDINKQIKMDT